MEMETELREAVCCSNRAVLFFSSKVTNYLLLLVSLFPVTHTSNLDNNPFSSDINFSLISRVVFSIFQRR